MSVHVCVCGGGGDNDNTYFNIISQFLTVIILVPALGDLGVDAGVLTTG